MASASIVKSNIEYGLILNEHEASYLKQLTQNYLGTNMTESSLDSKHREAIFNALKAAGTK